MSFVFFALLTACGYRMKEVARETVISVSGQRFKVPSRYGIEATALDLCIRLPDLYRHNKDIKNPGYLDEKGEVIYVLAYGIYSGGKEKYLGSGKYYIDHLEQCFTVGMDDRDAGFDYIDVRPSAPINVKQVVWYSHLYL